jgi:hypothetical protein
MKMAVFWYVAPCGLVEVYGRLRDTSDVLPSSDRSSTVDASSTSLLQDYTAQHPRRSRLSSSSFTQKFHVMLCIQFTYDILRVINPSSCCSHFSFTATVVKH